MRTIIAAIVFFLYTVVSISGADSLKQDFEGPVFPPTGWAVTTNGTGPYWAGIWTSTVQDETTWAYGSAVAGEGSGLSTADAKLFTPVGTLDQGNILTIRFICRGEISPPVAVQNYIKVSLFNGSDEVWHYSVYAGQVPSPATIIKLTTTAVPESSANYQVCWWLHAVGGSTLLQTHSSLYVDDVVITRFTANKTNCVPSTLGQLKASYAR